MQRTTSPLAPLVIFLVLTLSAPSPVAAQAFLEKLFTSITDVAISYTPGSPLGEPLLRSSFRSDTTALQGLSLEILYNIGTLGDPMNADHCKRATRVPTYKTDRLIIRSANLDSLTPIDSLFLLTPDADELRKTLSSDCKELQDATVEFALGYQLITGFNGLLVTDNDSIPVRGSVEELPSLSAYITLDRLFGCTSAKKTCAKLYFGAHTAISALKTFRAYTSTKTLEGKSTTWMLGGSMGVWLGPQSGAWGLFVEPRFTYRNFRSIDWGDAVSPALQRNMNLSTFAIGIGAQFEIKAK